MLIKQWRLTHKYAVVMVLFKAKVPKLGAHPRRVGGEQWWNRERCREREMSWGCVSHLGMMQKKVQRVGVRLDFPITSQRWMKNQENEGLDEESRCGKCGGEREISKAVLGSCQPWNTPSCWTKREKKEGLRWWGKLAAKKKNAAEKKIYSPTAHDFTRLWALFWWLNGDRKKRNKRPNLHNSAWWTQRRDRFAQIPSDARRTKLRTWPVELTAWKFKFFQNFTKFKILKPHIFNHLNTSYIA